MDARWLMMACRPERKSSRQVIIKFSLEPWSAPRWRVRIRRNPRYGRNEPSSDWNERRDFSALYSLSHRHLADDGRHSVCRPRRLSAAAGRAVAAGGLPHDSDYRHVAGRE